MIKSEHGTVEIDGISAQILLDFAHIYSDLIKVQPEIVAATVLHFDEKLAGADMDNNMVKSGEMLLSHLIEDGEDDDNE